MNIINKTDALAALCGRLADADYVTVDTEFMRESTFWPILCLVQVAGPDDEAIIDPLADGIDLSPLYDLIGNDNVLKVMHAAKQDIEIFHHEGGVTPKPLFDTQIAAMVAGFGDQVGYETLISKLTNVRPDKGSRFTDWSQRPLTDAQLEYALADVTHLRPAYEKLRRQIEKSGRLEWIEEEMVKVADPKIYEVVPEESWRRLKPKRNQPKYLAMLQAVAAWRDREAMDRNLPRNRLMRDDVLAQIAARPPEDEHSLQRMRGIPKNFASGRLGQGLLAAISEGRAMPNDRAPTITEPVSLPPGTGALMDLLKVLLKFKCDTRQVAQKLVATVADLESIAAASDADVPALKGWRRDIFGNDALRLKAGEIALAANHGKVQIIEISPERAATEGAAE
ncbi:MAG: ribonuclease D [Alphaproteobacteria bacterium]|nr:ribonuclease D [Alphaproteobacteria bacterium]HCP00494.1 ribonuclease D [Rhodospirillaceae bacterium]